MSTAVLNAPFNVDAYQPLRAFNSTLLRRREISEDDIDALLAIERQAFEYPWSRDDFEACLGVPNVGGFLVERDGRPLGYLFYEERRRSYRLISCAIVESARRQGVGTALVQALVEKLDAQRSEISCVVRERNYAAQLFLRQMGFRSLGVVKGYYSETEENARRMTFKSEEWAAIADYSRRRLLARCA